MPNFIVISILKTVDYISKLPDFQNLKVLWPCSAYRLELDHYSSNS